VPAICPGQQSATPAKPERSKESFVYETLHTSVRFEMDGTGTTESSAVILLQAQAAVEQFGLLTLSYNSANEDMTIDYVRVRKPDGTVVATPPENFVDMPSDITRVAPVYSDVHEKHIAVRGLGVGDRLEYKARTQLRSALVPNQFWYAYSFYRSGTVLDEELEANLPQGMPVNVKSTAVQPSVRDDGNRRVYTWKSSHEGEKPEVTESLGDLPPPSVQVTTFRNWEEVGRWWGELEEQRAAVTPEIRAKALELTKDAKTDEEKIRRIFRYVSTQFRYISVSFGIGRYQPHAATDVLYNAYGDCKDKHTLLEALLKAVGIEADPALISATHKLDPAVPSPAQFDHVISFVPQGDQDVWLDTTEEVAPYGFLLVNLRGKQALAVTQGKPASLVTTPADPPFPMTDDWRIDGKISSDGVLDVNITRALRGDMEVLLRAAFRAVPESKWKDLVQGLSYAGGFAGEVSEVTVSPPENTDKPFQYSYHYHRKDYPEWSAQRLVAISPAFAIPELKDDPKEAAKPVELGGKIQGTVWSRIELPKGFAPRLLQPVDVVRDFGEFHSSYSFKDGALIAERKIILKTKEVAAARRDDYKPFEKAVSDDRNAYTYVIPGSEAVAAVPPPKPEAADLFEQARQSLSAMDRHTAIDKLEQAVKIDPNFALAWSMLGSLHLSLGQTDEAFADFKKAVAADPTNVSQYQILSFQLVRMRRVEEAIDLWRDLLKRAPNQKEAHANLGALLMQQKKYDESIREYEAAVRLSEPNSTLQMELGDACFAAGSDEKAVAAYEKAVEIEPGPLSWNNLAYALADHKTKLPEAERFATQAVQAVENESAKINLDSLSDSDLRRMDTLASYWDTLGWVYFREGDYEEAEKYLEAAWDLEQSQVVGEHLGQVYEALGKKAAATHQLALAKSLQPQSPAAGRPPELIRRGGATTSVPGLVVPAEELSEMRRVKLGKFPGVKGSAEFWVLLGLGPKVEGVKFISGDEHMRSLESAVRSAKFNVVFPDSQPTKLIRRGVLFCGQLGLGCDFTLFPVEKTTRAAD
jgi:tetratricopeptide (TPR) repeat protein